MFTLVRFIMDTREEMMMMIHLITFIFISVQVLLYQADITQKTCLFLLISGHNSMYLFLLLLLLVHFTSSAIISTLFSNQIPAKPFPSTLLSQQYIHIIIGT